jgi:hypothetical protein
MLAISVHRTRINGPFEGGDAMTGLDKNYSTWQPEFRSVLTERERKHLPEKIMLAENAIFDRIDSMEALPVSIDDVDERCAMSSALSILRGLQIY